jgi:hypothetical protein
VSGKQVASHEKHKREHAQTQPLEACGFELWSEAPCQQAKYEAYDLEKRNLRSYNECPFVSSDSVNVKRIVAITQFSTQGRKSAQSSKPMLTAKAMTRTIKHIRRIQTISSLPLDSSLFVSDYFSCVCAIGSATTNGTLGVSATTADTVIAELELDPFPLLTVHGCGEKR